MTAIARTNDADTGAYARPAPPCARPRIAIVDDEPEIRGMVADYLDRDGYAVVRCASGDELDAVLRSGAMDLVLLDVNMPGEDGLSIARRLRGTDAPPIIMLSALDDIVDRVVGFEVGADDYLTKPFDLRELRARVRAMLRRASPGVADARPAASNGNLIPFGKVRLDLDGHCLRDADGGEIRLTPSEFNLLAAFARCPNRVLSREQLMECAPGSDRDPLDRAIDIRVTRIRKKIEIEPAKPQVIRTVRNAGYVYVPSAGG
jgi:two-component system, OmpR family, response regulator